LQRNYTIINLIFNQRRLFVWRRQLIKVQFTIGRYEKQKCILNGTSYYIVCIRLKVHEKKLLHVNRLKTVSISPI